MDQKISIASLEKFDVKTIILEAVIPSLIFMYFKLDFVKIEKKTFIS